MTQPEVSRIELVDLRPNDVIIATLNGEFGADAGERVRDYLKTTFPGHAIVVKSDAITLRFARDPS